MKMALLVFITGAAAFAAGWFLKPSGETGVAGPFHAAAAKAAPPVSRGTNPFREAMAPAAGSGSAAVQPFRSIDEVLALMEGLIEDDELGDLAALEMMEALPRLMVTDISSVRSLLEQLRGAAPKTPELRLMAAAMLAGRWILQEPEAATGYILANPVVFGEKRPSKPGVVEMFDENDARGFLAMFGIAMTARKNPGAANAMLGLLPDEYGGDLREMLTLMEAKADPGKFLTTSSKETLEAMDDLTPILARWAKQDPQAAIRWAQTFEDTGDDAWPAIAKSWADKDRAAATAWASLLTDADHRRAALGAIASKAVEGLDAAAAPAALAAFPPEVAAQARLEQLSSGEHIPAESEAMVQDILARYSGDSLIMEAAAGPAASVVQEFVKEENGETRAIAWLATLPEGAAKSRAVTTLIDQWAEDDPAAASAWIKDLPDGDTRESATRQLISEISGDDPGGALEWAKSISSEETRREQAHSIFKKWLQKDPHAAVEALQQFPAEEQAAMFKE